jgi:hypothetical protein
MKLDSGIMIIAALAGVVLVCGCAGQAPIDCGTNLTCLRDAQSTCAPSTGRYINSTLGIDERIEVRGLKPDGTCEFMLNISEIAGNMSTSMDCALPQRLWSGEGITANDTCTYCSGPAIDAIRAQGSCQAQGIVSVGGA